MDGYSGDWTAECQSCDLYAGPEAGGCYLPAGLSGPCGAHWSSSPLLDGTVAAWEVFFNGGFVCYDHKAEWRFVRCVR